MLSRWLVYQKERFPLAQYIPMMTVFGFCAVSFSMHLDDPHAAFGDASPAQYLTAAATTLCWFMLLRVADEHKDYLDDCAYRPYRPVQRGLVSLRELRRIGVALGLIQIGLSLWIDSRLLLTLGAVYFWFALMSAEFFVPAWLKARPTLYLLSHMIIMPFIDLYATSVEWLPRGGHFSPGLLFYMISSFCDGTVVEVGRKLRAPENEEYGVDTYTQIWGPRRAITVWLVCLTLSGISTVLAGFLVRVGFLLLAILSVLYIFAVAAALRFASSPTPANAKFFTVFPGVWMLVMYCMLGLAPFFFM
ncbi:MAG: UbiA family prenyltransferase [Gracilibacteraceae bacterium]|jgi:4-hydroxybenzoate polyprenyltransferase|nr:UbiA family prenyltransferase [Gracilibacteraceae bacterium]